ncbi:MAG: hypothetical protein QNJ74_21195 [Trichodesmium sp. MO_231.B1]|nr:hypothetical protein [Trichodesmium sp. MO_231.B1]
MPDTPINKGIENTGTFVNYGGQVSGIGQQQYNNNSVPPEVEEIQNSLCEIIKKYPNEAQALEVAKKDPKIKKLLNSATSVIAPIVLKETVSPLVRPLTEKLLSLWHNS